MDNKILGLNPDVFYVIIIVLALIILGIVTFHYYAYVKAGGSSVMDMGVGAGITVLPGYGRTKENYH